MSNGNNEFSWWSDALSGVKTPSVGLKPQQEEEQDKNVEDEFSWWTEALSPKVEDPKLKEEDPVEVKPVKLQPLKFDEEEAEKAGVEQFFIDKAAAFGSGFLSIGKGLSEAVEAIPDAAVQSYMNISDAFTDNDYTEEDRKKAADFIETSFTLDQYLEEVQKVTDSYRTKYDKDMLDSFSEGDYLAFTDQLISGVFGAVPSLLVSAVPGGIIALGASETGNTYEELSEASPDSRGAIMLSNALLQGSIEAASEAVMRKGVGSLSKIFGRKKAIKGVIQKVVYGGAEEAISETLAAESNNALDGFYTDNKFTNSKGEFDFTNVSKRVIESLLISSVIGGGRAGIDGSKNTKRLYNETLTPENIKEENLKLSLASTKLRAINKKAQNEDVSRKISRIENQLKENKKTVSDVLGTYTNEEVVDQVNLQKEITETQAQIKNNDLNEISKKELESQIDIKRKKLENFYNSKKNQLTQERVEESVSFAQTAEKDLQLSDASKSSIESIEDQNNFNSVIDKSNLDETSKQNAKKDFSSTGAFVLDDKIYVNKKVAAETQQINIGAHEIFHKILNKVAKTIEEKQKIVNNFKSKFGESNVLAVDAKIQRDYSKFTDRKGEPRVMTEKEFNDFKQTEEYFNEFLPNASDLLTKETIKFNETTFTKVGDFLHGVFRPVGFKKATFKDANGVYDFMKTYQKSIGKGEVNQKLKDVTSKEFVSKSNIESYKQTVNESRSIKAQEKEINDLVENITKEDWDSGKGTEITNKVFTKIQELVKSKIPETELRNTKFSEKSFVEETINKLIPHVKKFNPENNQSLSEWINSELDNDISKIYKTPKKPKTKKPKTKKPKTKKPKTEKKDDGFERIFNSLAKSIPEMKEALDEVKDDISFSKTIKINLSKEMVDLLEEKEGKDIIKKIVEYSKRVIEIDKNNKDINKKRIKDKLPPIDIKDVSDIIEDLSKEYPKVAYEFVKILDDYDTIKSNRKEGHIAEIRVFNLMAKNSEDLNLGFELLQDDGLGGYDRNSPDIQFNFTPSTIKSGTKDIAPKKSFFEGLKLEVKSGVRDPMGSGRVQIKTTKGKNGEDVFDVSIDGVENSNLLLTTLEEFNFTDRVQMMWKFFNNDLKIDDRLEKAWEEIGKDAAETIETENQNITKKLGSLFEIISKDKETNKIKRKKIQGKEKISSKSFENYTKWVEKYPQYKLDFTTKGTDFGIQDIAYHYNNKENYFIEIGKAGAFFLGTKENLGENIFNLPLLTEKNISAEFRLVLKFDSSKDGSGLGTFRVRSFLQLTETKKGALSELKSDFTFTKPKTIQDGFESNDSNYQTSKSLSEDFNDILENVKNVDATKVYTKRTAAREGRKKGRYKFFVPPSADNFMGLMYSFLGKGKVGDKQKDFFESALMGTYKRGVSAMENTKQNISNEYKSIKKKHFGFVDQLKLDVKLNKQIPGTFFNYDAALRVYIWDKSGVNPSDLDLTTKEVNDLVEAVKADPKLASFANDLSSMSSLEGKYPTAGEFWDAESISSDLNNFVENNRKEYLKEFIENSKGIFSEENLNKVEAIYGAKFRESLEGSLESMKSGKLRKPLKKGSLEEKWLDWLNGSTAAIMFLNVRSAVLQTVSSVNYLNWGDNNPVKAASAFANQKQFWKDWSYLFFSNKLKQRRSGAKINISEAEISKAVSGRSGVNSTKSVIQLLLRKGFVFTQIADSFAIALGGASMYRNRVNTNLSKGMDIKDAELAAFEDFSAITEETQQSSDPSEISAQQRSHTGRIFLAFANTPLQYARLTKKAYLDIKNGRGDFKTNLSKIVYYAAVQNIIFNGLQTALFATLGFGGDDEDDKKNSEVMGRQLLYSVNGIGDSLLKGFGVQGVVLSALKNGVIELYKQQTNDSVFSKDFAKIENALLSVSPPLGSKFSKLYGAYKQSDIEKDIIKAKGFSVDSPIYQIGGKVISGFTNLPLDRAVKKFNNMSDAVSQDYDTWQSILLALGWDRWSLGIKNEEHDLIRTSARDARKKEGYKKAAATRKKNREIKMQNKRRESGSSRRSGGGRRESSTSSRRR